MTKSVYADMMIIVIQIKVYFMDSVEEDRRKQLSVWCQFDTDFFLVGITGLECKTRAEADIVLLVDGSWSIGRPNFKTIRSFIGRIVEVFDIGPDNVQIGKSWKVLKYIRLGV